MPSRPCRLVSPKKRFSVVSLAVKCPQGSEKQLIKAALDHEVPRQASAGGRCGGATSPQRSRFTEACRWSKPLIERVLTLSGDAAAGPATSGSGSARRSAM